MQINCDPDSQWESAYSGDVEFDSDIVGPGVIASFIAAALTALLTLLAGFTTCSIPPELINDADGIVARALRSGFTSLRTFLHIPSFSQTDGAEAHEDRLRAFQTFLLSVSDQVLASELAILIAAYIGHADITLYSVNVVIALGCLASTVHLAMMPLLVRHIRSHNVIKASRSLTIVAVAVMLVVLLIFQLSDTWRDKTHIYFQCAFDDYQLDVPLNWAVYATQLLVAAILLYGNYEVIRLLYSRKKTYTADEGAVDPTPVSNPGPTTTTPSRKPRIHLSSLHNELTSIQDHSHRSTLRRAWARHQARNAAQHPKMTPRRQRLYALRLAESLAFHECQESFLWRILWLLAGNIYGITEVFQTRSDTEGISGDRDKMGYGQIVPLVLLILPAFAAVQSVYDYRDSIRGKKAAAKPSSSSSPSPPLSAIELDELYESPNELATAGRVPTSNSSRRVKSATFSRLPRSRTTATQESQTSTNVPRNRRSLIRSSTEDLADVYRASTLDPPPDQNPSFPASASQGQDSTIALNSTPTPPLSRHSLSLDKSLYKFTRPEKYTSSELPFISTFVYLHTILMLIFVVLFASGLAYGPGPLVAVVYAILLLIVMRRSASMVYLWTFEKQHREELERKEVEATKRDRALTMGDTSQGMMHANATGEIAEEE
ncbi:hypothetical protein BJX70DRAFT_2467 [Aspergillus crustosus]